jgi:hypothetical protein
LHDDWCKGLDAVDIDIEELANIDMEGALESEESSGMGTQDTINYVSVVIIVDLDGESDHLLH